MYMDSIHMNYAVQIIQRSSFNVYHVDETLRDIDSGDVWCRHTCKIDRFQQLVSNRDSATADGGRRSVVLCLAWEYNAINSGVRLLDSQASRRGSLATRPGIEATIKRRAAAEIRRRVRQINRCWATDWPLTRLTTAGQLTHQSSSESSSLQSLVSRRACRSNHDQVKPSVSVDIS